MARTERKEGERWSEAQQEGRWPGAQTDERWPEAAENEERRPEPEYEGRRRTGRLRVEIPPIVNPYSVVALVAALLGLFPVAIVFGFIAFSHPRGKTMAVFALMIGVAEVTALAGFVVLSGSAWSDAVSRPNQATEITSVAPQPTVAATTTVSTTAAPTAAPTSAASNLVTPKKGASCSEPALIGTAADGSTLLCLSPTGASGSYQWSGPYTVATAVQEAGTRCDSSGTKSGRSADGRALACDGKVWALWTE
jgi:hypothetical protein